MTEGGNNSPLRGGKRSYFNGGIRGVGLVVSPLLSSPGVQYSGLVHVSDWMPTLVNLAGGDLSDLDLDGLDVWQAIRFGFNLGWKRMILCHCGESAIFAPVLKDKLRN